MNNIKILSSPDEIDLARHGVIEAHAGTGKTYTIVQMVMRILQQTVEEAGDEARFIHIREILLVTYTEKAAGELKKRIREGIEALIAELQSAGRNDCTALIVHLENCLNNLHEAFIGTIHGVCLRLLQTWPFETGVHFNTQMVDDSEGLLDAQRESLRTDWQRAETHIPWALEQVQARGLQLEEKHFTLVRGLARGLLNAENAVLDRRTIGGFTLERLKALLDGHSAIPGDCRMGQDFLSLAGACVQTMTSIIKDPRGFFNDSIICELQRRIGVWESLLTKNQINPDTFSDLKTYGDGNRINTASTRKHPLFEQLKDFHESIPAHPFLRIVRGETLPLTLFCDAAELLRDRWVNTKQTQGLISFEDMLRLMHQAVFGNPTFCIALRRRLRFGIIDEFQDTSILQWRIFNRLFLETSADKSPRLFIVGDPKQSIYSFQGADVQSYLDAKSAIVTKQGLVYGLVNNYRSLPGIIDGCNAILAPDADGKDWFAFDASLTGGGGISYPSHGTGGEVAHAPPRSSGPAYGLTNAPVSIQVMALAGSAPQRRKTMAEWTSRAIQALAGSRVSIPEGLQWKNITLDYQHFAVIVENHALADWFLECFQNEGIPAVKYKMSGVFQSPMARDLHALLRAVLYPSGDPAPRLAALLTHFFNKHPAEIDPERDLEPCRKDLSECRHGRTCLAHALEEWTACASKQRWSQLFSAIQERTGVRELLITLADGDRYLADLRQVIDYCIEKLYRDNYSLRQLVEHLGNILDERESVGQDQNLHVLATGKASVKVLTVHAAKGLEFPVVFAATGGSREARRGPDILAWIDDDRRKHLVPYVKIDEARAAVPGERTAYECMMAADCRERRRLLYVALTRAQALLFVPLHLERATIDNNGRLVEHELLEKIQKPDTDLTPRLLQVLEDAAQSRLALFTEAGWAQGRFQKKAEAPAGSETVPIADIPDIRTLDLPGRVSRQTSYSELSREVDADRTLDRSEEVFEADDANAMQEKAQRPVLPGGKQTGDALHLVIEELLRAEKINDLIRNNDSLTASVHRYLKRNGVFKYLSDVEAQTQAVMAAVAYIKGALTTPLALPSGEAVTIADLPPADRVPEMEFLLGAAPHWVHGFMDLVFRVRNDNAAHPWRYFVLDWKSDQLERFEPAAIDAHMQERHYDLQARIYCHALDTWLKAILGDGYDPDTNLGGAVYVFVRGFNDPGVAGIKNTWCRHAEPRQDAAYVQARLSKL
jgi:exodeoxyribonuclease V beta subunit